ncbi:MAG: hypothetical protein FWF77_02295 [Defluviitaleaceae bacterium]|nr:hypothetical protein [Defluviitaleaceae bacterium]
MSAATHSLEAGCRFSAHKKARQARSGHRGHVSESAHSLEAGSSFLAHKKTSRRVTLADSFFSRRETASDFKRMHNPQHIPPAPTTHLARRH